MAMRQHMRITRRMLGFALASGLGPALAMAMLSACRAQSVDDSACSCTPGNVSRTRSSDGTSMDGAALLGKLRRHRQDVQLQKNARDVKVFDDELRLALISFCQPCGDWIKDRLTIDDMFPLQRLDDAADAVCLGLVLRDGTTVHGAARPLACR
jgi:hypothetical protein